MTNTISKASPLTEQVAYATARAMHRLRDGPEGAKAELHLLGAVLDQAAIRAAHEGISVFASEVGATKKATAAIAAARVGA